MFQPNNHTGGGNDDDRDDIEKAIGKVTEGIGAIFTGLAGQKRRKITPEAEAFFKAVRTNNAPAIAEAVRNGMSPETLSANGETALILASRMNLPQSMTALLSAGADPKKKGGAFNRLPLEEAVHYGSAAAADVLARCGGYVAGPMADGKSLLRHAVEKDMGDVVRALLRAGADPNELTENGSTPLIIAISLKKPAAAAALMEFQDVTLGMNAWRAATDERKRSAFQLAVEHCGAEAVGKMAAQGAFVNAADAEGMTPMRNAIARGDLALIKTLAHAGADLNRADAPLVFACETPHIASPKLRGRVVALLIELGADPDQMDPESRLSPLHAAAACASGEDALQVLVDNKASLDRLSGAGNTALAYAAHKRGVPERSVRILKDAGADPDVRLDAFRRTALMKAVSLDSKQAVERLLDAGADARLKDVAGKTAFDYLRSDSDPDIARLLTAALQKPQAPKGPQP